MMTTDDKARRQPTQFKLRFDSAKELSDVVAMYPRLVLAIMLPLVLFAMDDLGHWLVNYSVGTAAVVTSVFLVVYWVRVALVTWEICLAIAVSILQLRPFASIPAVEVKACSALTRWISTLLAILSTTSVMLVVSVASSVIAQHAIYLSTKIDPSEFRHLFP